MEISLTIVWLVSAAILGIAEMLVGTFYLLVLAGAAVVAAVASLMNATLEWQLAAFAVVALAGSLWVRRFRALNAGVNEKEVHQLQNLDEGQLVEVANFDEQGRTKVQYRGAEWMAQAASGQALTAGAWRIVEVKGNVLVIEKN
ncbi:MAG: NfeD family protein [Burkholderiaceae bacterium]|nr:NfeD family protein [Burkholderiaceae bacterium]